MEQKFFELLDKLHCPKARQSALWTELHKHYTSKKRHYHNLHHLNAMFIELEKHEDQLEDPEILKFSVWYHDIIYNSAKSSNEELSAQKAENILSSLNMDAKRTERCFNQIIATKTHTLQGDEDQDLKLLLDIDLEVLGRTWEAYQSYTTQIRKEYSIYPWFIYKRGRKKALTSLLQRDAIYHTELYRKKLEFTARQNIKREINELLR